MCEPTTYVKFCTCDAAEIDPARCWRLSRAEEQADKPGLDWVGEIEPPIALPADVLLQEKIAADLNQHLCFDFPYDPVEGDVLKVRFGDRIYGFQFIAGRWSSDDWTTPGDLVCEGRVGTERGWVYPYRP